jgi:3-oxoacyl-[acyl-carrier protein] reductase
MPQDLSGKNAIVTGGSRGIGRALALGLAMRGASVAVGYRSSRRLAAEVVKDIQERGCRAVAVGGDLSREADVTALFDRAEQVLGRLDFVYANAGDVVIKPLIDCTEEDYERVFGANAKGVFFTLREAARRVRDGGRIVVSSTGGTRMFFSETSLYLGSKGAVEQFVRTLSRELAPRGITVNALSPGFTNTDLLPERDRRVAAEMSPFRRIGEPAEVADVGIFLATDEARWITGQNLAAGGGVF